jgi:hypothetical protein
MTNVWRIVNDKNLVEAFVEDMAEIIADAVEEYAVGKRLS